MGSSDISILTRNGVFQTTAERSKVFTFVFGIHGYGVNVLRANDLPWLRVAMEHLFQSSLCASNREKSNGNERGVERG